MLLWNNLFFVGINFCGFCGLHGLTNWMMYDNFNFNVNFTVSLFLWMFFTFVEIFNP